MSSMLEHVPDAGSYAPVTILIDERAGIVAGWAGATAHTAHSPPGRKGFCPA